jgi:hypothetical protein
MPAIAQNVNVNRTGTSGNVYAKAAPTSYAAGSTRPSPAALLDKFIYETVGGLHQISDGIRWYDLQHFGGAATAGPQPLVSYTSAGRPTASTNTGVFIRNSTTGLIEMSNGTDWVPMGANEDASAEAKLGIGVDGLPAPARITSPTTATTVYIDPSQGTNGSGTFGSPRNTIPTTVANTAYLIKAGTTLTQTLNLGVSGASDQPIVIGVYNAATGARVTTRGAATLSGSITISGTFVYVEGLVVTGNASNGKISVTGNDVTILACQTNGGTQHGIFANNVLRFRVDGCEANGNGASGIKIDRTDGSAQSGMRIQYNDLKNNAQSGLIWETPGSTVVTDSQIASNTMWDNGINTGYGQYDRCSIALWMEIGSAAGSMQVYRNDLRRSCYSHVRLQSRSNTPAQRPDGLLCQNNYMFGSTMPIHWTNIKGAAVIELNKIERAGSNDGTTPAATTRYGRAIELFGNSEASRCEGIKVRRNALYRSYSLDTWMTEGMGLGLDDNTAFVTCWGNWVRECEGSAVQYNTNIGNVCGANVFIDNCKRPTNSALNGPVGPGPAFAKLAEVGGSGSDCLSIGNFIIAGREVPQQRGGLVDEPAASGFEYTNNYVTNADVGAHMNSGTESHNRFIGCVTPRATWGGEFSPGGSTAVGTGSVVVASSVGTSASAHLAAQAKTALESLPFNASQFTGGGTGGGGTGDGGTGGGGGGGVAVPVVTGGDITKVLGASLTMTKPAGAAGATQIALVMVKPKAAAVTMPAGWVQIVNAPHPTDGVAPADGKLVAFSRSLTATEAAGTVVASAPAATMMLGGVVNVASATAGAPVLDYDLDYDYLLNAPAVTVGSQGSIRLFAFGPTNSPRTFTPPAGVTLTVVDQDYLDNGVTGAALLIGYDTVQPPSAVAGAPFELFDPFGGVGGERSVMLSIVMTPSSGGGGSAGITSITVAPSSLSLAASGTATVTVTGSNGAPVVGASATSLAPGVATVTGTTNGSGELTVTGTATGGSTTIAISYTDPTNGVLTATVPVTVALATPAAPSGLTATAQSATSVLLGWVDNASTETAFRIERADALAGPFVQIGTVAANVVAFTDPTVVAQRTYYYRVIASNLSGTSAPSSVVAVTTPAAVDATAPTCALTVSVANVTAAGSPVTLSAIVSDNVGVTLVRYYRNGVEFASVPVVPVPGTASTVTQSVSFASNAENGVWSYTARAFDAAGNSTLSGAVAVTVAIPAPAVVPNAPSGLTAIGGANVVTIAWTDNSTNEDGFYIERRVGAGSFAQVATLGAGVISYTDTGLLAATAYTYRVRAFGAGGASGYTSEATASTSAAPATSLASVSVAPTVVSDIAGRTATLTYTARDGNGSGRPGVTITPVIGSTAVATVAPPSAITDAQGRAFLTVTFGSVIAQTQLRVAATDGASTLTADVNPAVDVFTLPAFTEALVKELQAEQQDPKYEDEIQPYVFDFSPFLGRGEDVSRIQVVESVPVSNAAADPAASAMVFGQARIVGDRVLQYFRDGVPGVSYFLRCRVETTIGRVVVSEIRIRIYRARGARVSSSSPVVD